MVRYRQVLEAYARVIQDLGDVSTAVSKSYIYDRVSCETCLCTKTVAYVINHCKPSELREQ